MSSLDVDVNVPQLLETLRIIPLVRMMGKEEFRLVLESALNKLDTVELNVINAAMTNVHDALWNLT